MERPGLLGLGLGLAAAGAAVGAALERGVVRPRLRGSRADEPGPPFGGVRGPARVVVADDGVELYVEVDEPSPLAPQHDVTVVYSHGFSLNLDSWHYQRLSMQGVVRSVYWDQRGHGRSGRGTPEANTIDQLGADLRAVIEATAPTGRLVLVGHSMGGMTVMALADRDPALFGDRVVGVGLLSTSAGRMVEVTFGIPAAAARGLYRAAPGVLGQLGRRPDLVELGRRTGSDLEFLLTRRLSFASPVSAAKVDFVRQMIAATPVDTLAELFPVLNAHDKFAALEVLNGVETLVMVGANDLLTPADHSREIARLVPGAELVVLPECGHLIQLEYPDRVDAELNGLLHRVTRSHA